jgi:hypothetical protein
MLWLALCEAADSREAPLAVGSPPFRFLPLRRSPSEPPSTWLLDRAADRETGAAPVRGRGARLTER